MESLKLKAIFVTDLHGNRNGYDKTLENALNNGAELIINGGDIYPLGSNLFKIQRNFIGEFLVPYFDKCNKAGIKYISTLGNMDLIGLDDYLLDSTKQLGNTHILLDNMVEMNGYCFIGTPAVTDGPFTLKDRCYLDSKDNHNDSSDFGRKGLMSDERGINEVNEWDVVVMHRPSMSEKLNQLPEPDDEQKAVYVIHQPPASTSLAMISRVTDVGSDAVANFINLRQPMLTLHGHIHESPEIGGVWKTTLGETTCIQPGQKVGGKLINVLIDLDTLDTNLIISDFS